MYFKKETTKNMAHKYNKNICNKNSNIINYKLTALIITTN